MTERKKTKKLKSLIRFHSANKIDNNNRRGGIQKNLQNQSKHMNNKCFSWVTAVRSLSLAGSHGPPHLPRMPSSSVLISGPGVGAAQILIWSYACEFLPLMSTAMRTSAFSFVFSKRNWKKTLELSMSFYIFHRHRVCLVDCVDLICSLYSWWEGFGSSCLATLPLGFNCGFISTSACGSSTGVCSWGCPGGLGFVRARCGGGATLGSQQFWQHRVLRGVGG